MAIIKPFRGILYNPQKVNPHDVMCPPYDIISEELRERLYEKSPYNVVRIDYGKNSKEEDKYTLARKYLESWLKEGILIQDKHPCFYGYEIEYSYKNKAKKLRGVIGLIKLEELGKGVYPHEQTYAKPKADRLNLMKSCMANTSIIFSIYRSKKRITSQIIENQSSPFIQARDLNGNIHKLYRICSDTDINAIVEDFREKPIFIADGHHRYEVALEFKREMSALYPNQKDAAWNYVLMFLSNIEDDGYLILPTHRMVSTSMPIREALKANENLFDITEVSPSEDLLDIIEQMGPCHFGLYINSKAYILRYKGPVPEHLPEELRKLDVTILEEVILQRIFPKREVCYDIDIERGLRMIREGKCDALFLLRATDVEDIERVALAGLRMPPKSTYFYPKLLTGMIINSFRENL
ncbi:MULTISPECIES: DUF1015 domain-containing protein [Thermodesulfovibrio]|jgi:uncharacterized protein (DUF1015 family)|uniref:DUF1015 domain-containing protein n=1 Tax=Thermodesulfovibrio TaxID=28261 RepID=UPI00262DB13A|nr:DUF1015 domain-containing protein [Thermodesulfovibrio sp.]